jgi:hypothetical protein
MVQHVQRTLVITVAAKLVTRQIVLAHVLKMLFIQIGLLMDIVMMVLTSHQTMDMEVQQEFQSS